MSRLLLLIGLLMQASALAQPANAPLPIDYFTRHDDHGIVKISPDGEFLAVEVVEQGRSLLSIVALPERRVVRKITFDEASGIADFHWVSPQHLIYRTSHRGAGAVRFYWTTQIMALSRDGWRSKVLCHVGGTAPLGVPKNYPRTLMMVDGAEQPWVVALSPAWDECGRTEKLPLRDIRVAMDDNGAVRVVSGWTYDMTRAIRWRPKPDAAWTAIGLPAFDLESIVPRHFDSDGHSVLITAVRTGQPLSALYRLDLEKSSAESLNSFENEGVDVDGLVMDFSGHEPVGVVAHADRDIYHWLRPDDPAAVAHVQLQRAFPGQNVHITSASHDGRLAVVRVDSDINPGDYYLFDTKTAKADFLYGARTWIDPRQMRPKQPFELTARDGLKLHGYLTRPAGDGPFPLVVLPHAGPHDTRDYWKFDPHVQLLANRGYAVLQLNFRGSAGYGSHFVQAGYRQWGGRIQDDLTDATRWAIAQGIARSDRVCMYGMGFGGYSALMGAVREPDLYRCVISYGGFYDLGAVLGSNYLRGDADELLLTRMLGQDRAELQAYSPLKNVERIRAATLLIHGTRDRRVEGLQAERMKWALKMAGKPAELMLLSGEDHEPYGEDHRRAMYERILGFLDQHLKQAPLTTAP